MPPYVPYIGLSRSQSVRIGRGPGNTMASQMNMGDTPTNPDTGALATLFYADLGNPWVRRDLQHHSTLGALDSVGSASNTVYSDLFKVDGLGLTPSGTNMNVAVAAGNLQSRFYNTRLAVPAQTVTLTAPTQGFGGQMNYVYVGPNGVVGVYQGQADTSAPVYEVWSVTATSATAGTFTLQFQYGGFVFTTAGIAFNATGAAVATAVQAATGGPNNVAFSTFVGGTGNITGGGTALPGGPATVTFSGAAEGPVVPLFVDSAGLTGGTGAVVNRTTQGIGAQNTFPSGNALVLGAFYVGAAATNAAAATNFGTGLTLTA